MPDSPDRKRGGVVFPISREDVIPLMIREVKKNVGLISAGVLALGAVSFCTDRLHSNINYFSPDQANAGEALTPTPSTGVVSPEPVFTRVEKSERQKLEEYIATELKAGMPSNYPENIRGKTWTVVDAPHFAVKKVTTTEGIILKDYPDTKASREIPTGGPGSGPTIKSWRYGENPGGVFSKLVVMVNTLNSQVQVWAVRFSSEGGWPVNIHWKPFPEFSRISDSQDPEKEFVAIEVEGEGIDGTQIITVGELLSRSNPQIALPNPVDLKDFK